MPSPESAGYRPKSPEELRAQLQSADTMIDPDLGKEGSLVPPSIDEEDMLSMPLPEIKRKYARRYQMYVDILRDSKHPETGEAESSITQDDTEEMRKWLHALNSLDTYISKHHEGEHSVLRGKQVNVFEDLRDFLEAGGKSGYIKLPTGFGKTVLFIEFIEAMNLRSLIVVPTKQLITQTEDSMGRFAPDLEVGKVYQKTKEFGCQVTIITYDSMISQIKNGSLNPSEYDCVIFDEAHEALGYSTRNAVQQFTDSIRIGFTATPDYSEEKGVGKLLGTEIHRMNIREGVETGHLSSFVNRVVRTEADISKVRRKGVDLDPAQLEEAVNIESRNKAAVSIYKKGFDGELAVVYCVGIGHAHYVAEQFRSAGVVAEAIDGSMDDDERDPIFARYAKGETKVLCNADLLIMGFDEPKASVCLNLRPTKSGVIAEQRGGRVMRLDEGNQDKLAHIFDFVDKGSDESGIVLFAAVAGGTFAGNPDSKWGEKRRPQRPTGPPLPWIGVEGVDVVFDDDEIMRIEQRLRLPEKKKGRTIESVVAELEEAYQKWKAQPADTRGKFTLNWLIKNGYNGLYQWTRRNSSLDSLVVRASPELQENFEKRITDRSTESAVAELEAAYQKWKAQPTDTRGKFTLNWLIKNGYNGLYQWTRDHIDLDSLVAQASTELQEDFEKKERALESAVAELEAAYQKWKTQPRGKFNSNWLRENGHSGLYQWTRDHIDLDSLVVRASPELQKNFERLITDRSTESAVAELEVAHQAWKAQPTDTRGKFNSKWLEKNGHSGLYRWARKSSGLNSLVAQASTELQEDFEKRGSK